MQLKESCSYTLAQVSGVSLYSFISFYLTVETMVVQVIVSFLISVLFAVYLIKQSCNKHFPIMQH